MISFALVLRLTSLASPVGERTVFVQARDPSQSSVPFIEFEKTDVRVALSWLFQKVGANYRISPKVKGLVSVSLRNVPFETALQYIGREVEATYRIDGGVYEVVPREDDEPPGPPLKPAHEMTDPYASLRRASKEKRPNVPGLFVATFRFDPHSGKPVAGPAAIQAMFADVRQRPRPQSLDAYELERKGGVPTKAGVLLVYDFGADGTKEYWTSGFETPRRRGGCRRGRRPIRDFRRR